MTETKTVYHDYIPANARIIIDYDAKEKVQFSYPVEWTYKKAVWQRAYGTVIGFWAMLHYIALYPFLVAFPGIFIGFFLAILPHINFAVDLSEKTAVSIMSLCGILGIEFVFIAELFIIPFFITFFLSRDKERLARWIPKMGYWSCKYLGKLKETEFTPEHINEKTCVLSAFSNVYLDWKPTDDFTKYLTKIEILEIPFSFKKRRLWCPLVEKKIYNEWFFRAVFHFSEQPKTGSMLVEFI